MAVVVVVMLIIADGKRSLSHCYSRRLLEKQEAGVNHVRSRPKSVGDTEYNLVAVSLWPGSSAREWAQQGSRGPGHLKLGSNSNLKLATTRECIQSFLFWGLTTLALANTAWRGYPWMCILSKAPSRREYVDRRFKGRAKVFTMAG